MLNCWCITWPVGFKRLIDQHFHVILIFGYWMFIDVSSNMMSPSVYELYEIRSSNSFAQFVNLSWVQPTPTRIHGNVTHMSRSKYIPLFASTGYFCAWRTFFYVIAYIHTTWAVFWLYICVQCDRHSAISMSCFLEWFFLVAILNSCCVTYRKIKQNFLLSFLTKGNSRQVSKKISFWQFVPVKKKSPPISLLPYRFLKPSELIKC